MYHVTNFTKGLQHLGIPTQNIEDTIAFYCSIGFELIQTYETETGKVAFLKCDNLIVETYESETVSMQHGAIDHFCIDVDDIEKVYCLAKQNNLSIIDKNIQFLPFWENGVRFFNIIGPNGEKIEFGQIL